MSSGTAEASSEASALQGRVRSLVGGDRCSIPAQSDPRWTTSEYSRDVSLSYRPGLPLAGLCEAGRDSGGGGM